MARDFSQNCLTRRWHPHCDVGSQRMHGRRWSMTPDLDGETLESTSETHANESGAEVTTDLALAGDRAAAAPVRVPLIWIGTLANPHLGPMVVVGDGGYLV